MNISNKINVSQHLRQELKLKLTPEMRLRLNVLQATNIELRDILNKELMENPVLDDVIQEEECGETCNNDQAGDRTKEIDMDRDVARIDEIDEEAFENLFGSELPVRDFTKEYNPEFGKAVDYRYDSIRSREDNDIRAELMRQLNSTRLGEKEYAAVSMLIDYIDDNGFLVEKTEKISKEKGIEKEKLDSALDILRSFEPAGVGAEDARGSILLQMRRAHMRGTLAYNIVDRYFGLLTKRRFERLASIFKVSENNIKKAKKIISGMEPYPGRRFSTEVCEYVTPDIIMTKEDGEYKISMPGDFPEIRINKKYLELYKRKKETKTFIKGYENRVRALIGSLNDRNRTIKLVVKKIIEKQEGYLKNGRGGLKPLTLKEVADAVNLHESTVSRIVSKKYIQLPTGAVPLKDFFSSHLKGNKGDVSSGFVKKKIRLMVEVEDRKKPFTDTDIAKKLNGEGVKISRRTVTKYREQMDIFPVNVRKER